MAKHLSQTYGNKAPEVVKLAGLTGKRWPLVGKRLSDEFPYIEAEVKYSIREYASTAVDVIARRTRLAFLNVHVAEEVVPKIVEIMAKELGWDKNRQKVCAHVCACVHMCVCVWCVCVHDVHVCMHDVHA